MLMDDSNLVKLLTSDVGGHNAVAYTRAVKERHLGVAIELRHIVTGSQSRRDRYVRAVGGLVHNEDVRTRHLGTLSKRGVRQTCRCAELEENIPAIRRTGVVWYIETEANV